MINNNNQLYYIRKLIISVLETFKMANKKLINYLRNIIFSFKAVFPNLGFVCIG